MIPHIFASNFDPLQWSANFAALLSTITARPVKRWCALWSAKLRAQLPVARSFFEM